MSEIEKGRIEFDDPNFLPKKEGTEQPKIRGEFIDTYSGLQDKVTRLEAENAELRRQVEEYAEMLDRAGIVELAECEIRCLLGSDKWVIDVDGESDGQEYDTALEAFNALSSDKGEGK